MALKGPLARRTLGEARRKASRGGRECHFSATGSSCSRGGRRRRAGRWCTVGSAARIAPLKTLLGRTVFQEVRAAPEALPHGELYSTYHRGETRGEALTFRFPLCRYLHKTLTSPASLLPPTTAPRLCVSEVEALSHTHRHTQHSHTARRKKQEKKKQNEF